MFRFIAVTLNSPYHFLGDLFPILVNHTFLRLPNISFFPQLLAFVFLVPESMIQMSLSSLASHHHQRTRVHACTDSGSEGLSHFGPVGE